MVADVSPSVVRPYSDPAQVMWRRLLQTSSSFETLVNYNLSGGDI